MSRILKRPMFRKGGSTNEGIMTGLVDRKGYYNGDVVGRAKELAPGFAEMYREMAPAPRDTSLSEMLISGGLNLVSGRGAGSGLMSNIAESYKEPSQRFFQSSRAAKDYERQIDLKAADLGISTAMKEFDKLTKDERLEVEKLARLAFEADEFPSYEAALSEFLKAKIYSKSGYYRPDVQERIAKEQREADITKKAENYEESDKNPFGDNPIIAKRKATFFVDYDRIKDANPQIQFDEMNPFIDVEDKQTSYTEGVVYYNPADGQYYLYNGIVDDKLNWDPVEINLS